jgi:hypothetical protein
MEVIEILNHYIDKTQNVINVEFRMFCDDEDIIREDFIEYSFFEEFGYDDKKDFGVFETLLEEEDEWGDDYDYIHNESSLLSFLNEYYMIYPKKIPKPEFK